MIDRRRFISSWGVTLAAVSVGMPAIAGAASGKGKETRSMTQSADFLKYSEQVNSVFEVQVQEGLSVNLTLMDVVDDNPRFAAREPAGSPALERFSLFFNGSSDQGIAQGTYSMIHPALGKVELFIVPVIGGKDGKIRYQSAFCRLA